MTWRPDDPQGNEAGKIRYLLPPFTRGRGLDLGCGPSKAWPHFIGVDNYKDTGMFGIQMRPDVPGECDKLEWLADGSMDFVFSSHLLEHIEDHESALREWWRVIKPGGFLCLYLPDKDLYPNIGQPGANPDHVHDFTRGDILSAMGRIATETGQGFTLMINEQRSQGFEYSFFQVFHKRSDGQTVDSTEWLTPAGEGSGRAKTVCVVRYGGAGDMMQTAAILPQLKYLGYKVTLMTIPRGRKLMDGNPNVDSFLVQDRDQVPNAELPHYWRAWAERFDKFVNLSESVEGTLLAMPGRTNHAWPDSLRRRMLGGVNYHEFMADLAGVGYDFRAPLFFASKEEDEKARALLEPGAFNVVMALAGSSVHKVWPHMDGFMAKVLLKVPDAVIHLVGDANCMILEQGWELEPRVRRHSGKLEERLSIALAQRAQFVIGPETGIPNAVAFDNMPKVVLLSHSSAKNLTARFVNCTTIEPDKRVTKCYPCHRLHYGTEFCNMVEETSSALCATMSDPEPAAQAVERAWRAWKNRKERRAA